MTHPAPDGESLEDFVARISDVLRFVFAQQRDDVVVLVGETDSDRELLPQLQAAPSVSVAEVEALDDVVDGRTRIVRINDTLLVAL
jgi:broad specificity phosphatase PhoE